jgi:predicted O-methyltransferase YrrM
LRSTGCEERAHMDIVNEKVERYMEGLLEPRGEAVLEAMEAEGKERDFPIVGRTVGVTLEILARAVGARRVLEMGSGFGFSAYWFARAVGDGGEVYLTDGDPENERKARDYLSRAGLADRCEFHVGNALDIIDELPGEFDVIFCDIDKGGYPCATTSCGRAGWPRTPRPMTVARTGSRPSRSTTRRSPATNGSSPSSCRPATA